MDLLLNIVWIVGACVALAGLAAGLAVGRFRSGFVALMIVGMVAALGAAVVGGTHYASTHRFYSILDRTHYSAR